MALYQHTTTILSKSIDRLKCFRDPSPISNEVRRLYETLDGLDVFETGTITYPTASSSKRGMKLSFRNVSCTYDGPCESRVLAVDHVSFEVEPGQLVVIVGGNGSGKTSLLKLLCGLNRLTCGDILLDGLPIDQFNMASLRRSMAFLTQSEEIYPISLRENLLMGIPNVVPPQQDIDEYVDEAAKLGGAYDLIQRLGYETILDPPPVVGQSMRTCGNGDIGPGALEELRRNSRSCMATVLSAGEKQRLVASRTFMRIKNTEVKLVVVDEPTSALDPVAERDLFNNFCKLRKGKTVICVTHRFSNIVKQADLVFCMKRGKIVQQGTHAELMLNQKGEYRRLYMAQTD
ncbi:hypothetical protein DXG01_016510 [Tephrocybe rancida]|nr:hypothetical protein DXG01_016510 [Tephrocybe rancida]